MSFGDAWGLLDGLHASQIPVLGHLRKVANPCTEDKETTKRMGHVRGYDPSYWLKGGALGDPLMDILAVSYAQAFRKARRDDERGEKARRQLCLFFSRGALVALWRQGLISWNPVEYIETI